MQRLVNAISPPVPADRAVTYSGKKRKRAAMTSDSRLIALEAIDEAHDTPVGWRFERRGGHQILVPALKTPEGKAIAKRIADLNAKRPPFIASHLPGMPGRMSWSGRGVLTTLGSCQVVPSVDGKTIFAVWPRGVQMTADLVDTTIWEPILLSTYYRLIETGKLVEPSDR